MYLHFIGSQPSKIEKTISLPLPQVWISIVGCDFRDGGNQCRGNPKILFSGEEPLPGEKIMQVQGKIDGVPFSCANSECTMPIFATSENGVSVTFWGNSSYGDSTVQFDALVRVIPINNGSVIQATTNTTEAAEYYVDVISTQWKGPVEYSSCALIWKALTDVKGSPSWLDMPLNSSELNSTYPYHYLAGKLIQNSVVDASNCPSAGMENEISANECGMEAAQFEVKKWQNQFDQYIFKYSAETKIPAQLLKNVFARESQLWPGIVGEKKEVGFGHLTEFGADAALLWNPDYYSKFCPLVLNQETCNRGFGNLNDNQISMLRGALMQKVNSSCSNCSLGIDLSHANDSVEIFAALLLGNCNQVNQIFYNATNSLNAGKLSSYVDLWKFTLVNYNAGPGCLYNAIERTLENNDPLDWSHVSSNLETGCQKAIDYVLSVSGEATDELISYPTIATITTTGSASPTLTLTPTITFTPTSTHTLTPTSSTIPTVTITPTSPFSPTPSATPSLTLTPTPTESPIASTTQTDKSEEDST
jgi:hypothetical protein